MTNGTFPEGFAEAAAALAKNDGLRELLGQIMQNVSPASAGQDAGRSPSPMTDPASLASLVSPELLSALPSLIGALGASASSENAAPKSDHSDHDEHDAHHDHDDNHRSVNAPHKGPGGCTVAQRRALLTALRPFLSDNRRRALDVMIGIEKLGMIREPKG